MSETSLCDETSNGLGFRVQGSWLRIYGDNPLVHQDTNGEAMKEACLPLIKRSESRHKKVVKP